MKFLNSIRFEILVYLVLAIIASQVLFVSKSFAVAPISVWAQRNFATPASLYGVNSSMSCDLDGDGVDDMASGAYYDASQTGKVEIYFGGSSLSLSADVSIVGETTNTRFGDGMSCGDFNGDGIGDLSVGAVRYSAYAGRNYVFFGRSRSNWSAVNNASQADVIISGAAVSHLGNKSAIADVNGDGKGDLLIGAESDSTLKGKAYLFWGTSSPFSKNSSQADVIFNNDTNSGALGTEVELGNIIGDSRPDVYLSADNWQGAGIGSYCRALVFDGSTISSGTINISTADLTITDLSNATRFSYPGRIGDVNGDGVNDLVIGEDHFLVSNKGVLYVFYGGPGLIGNKVKADADEIIYGETGSPVIQSDLFSMSISLADINKDGKDDIITSAYYYTIPSGGQGRLYVFLGRSGLVGKTSAAQADYIIDNPAGINRIGWWTTAGDINNDGWAEFGSAVPTSGFYYIYSLSHIAPTVTLNAPASSYNQGDTIELTGTATDPDAGNIKSVQYSVDGGSWQDAAALDGSFDSTTENYTFSINSTTLSSITMGEHTISVRATDSENATTATADFATTVLNILVPQAVASTSTSLTAISTLSILPETGADLHEYQILNLKYFLF